MTEALLKYNQWVISDCHQFRQRQKKELKISVKKTIKPTRSCRSEHEYPWYQSSAYCSHPEKAVVCFTQSFNDVKIPRNFTFFVIQIITNDKMVKSLLLIRSFSLLVNQTYEFVYSELNFHDCIGQTLKMFPNKEISLYQYFLQQIVL